MRDSRNTEAEQNPQPWFSKFQLAATALLLLSIGAFAAHLKTTPNRTEMGQRWSIVRFEPVGWARLDAPFRLVGAWRLSSPDPRLGAISALAVDGGQLVALSDWGVVVRLPRPTGRAARALLFELPVGPGDPRFKSSRDAEALVRDPLGRGWWVAFENRNQIWLYDRRFGKALARVDFGRGRWHRNRGLEALTADGRDLLALPETERTVIRLRGVQAVRQPFAGRDRLSDAVRLPDGRLLLVERSLGPFGFRNRLAIAEESDGRFRVRARYSFGAAPLDNFEAVAVEPLGPRRVRLWLVTDDNLHPPLRTVLVALDWEVPRRD